MEQTQQPAATISRWWVLFLVHFSVLAFALNFQMIPPLLPSLISRIGLTHTQAGALMGLFTLPGIFLALPGGRVSDAIGPRSVALWSLALLTVGPFLMLPLHPWFLYTGRICSGVGGAVLVVVAPQIIARFFHGRELGLAMGIFNTSVPVGTILAFNVLGSLAGSLSISVVLVITACFSFLALAAFFFTYADPVQSSSEMSAVGRGTIRGLGKGIWLVSLVWVLFNISILAYFTFTIDHFIASGMNGSTARFLSSLPMLLSIFLTPIVGFSIHRYGLRWSRPLIGCYISTKGYGYTVVSYHQSMHFYQSSMDILFLLNKRFPRVWLVYPGNPFFLYECLQNNGARQMFLCLAKKRLCPGPFFKLANPDRIITADLLDAQIVPLYFLQVGSQFLIGLLSPGFNRIAAGLQGIKLR